MAPGDGRRISWDDVLPHLRSTLFITGSFCVAWTWDLVAYGASHAWAGENPMRDEIGFGNQRAPKYLAILLLQYIMVCGGVAFLSYTVKQRYYSYERWCPAAIMAIEFLPAPFFSGKLMSYLGQFSGITSLEQVLYNLLATAFAAFLAHTVQGSYNLPNNINSNTQQQPLQVQNLLPPQLERFPPILSETLGFGLGVAWNVFLTTWLAPEKMDLAHIIALFGYLLVVLMIAFRIAAAEEDGASPSNGGDAPGQEGPSLMQRMLSMLSFAANVVCAFTMVAFVHAMVAPGWGGDFLCLLILALLAAIMSAMVASVDMEDILQQRLEEGQGEPKYGFGTCCAMDALVFVPCIWCCCPWIPLLWILAGVTPNIAVKERWQKLIAFVLGLATSIQASGMFTTLTNVLAMTLGLCGEKHCSHRWAFVGLQIFLAGVSTVILLPALAYVTSETGTQESEAETQRSGEGRPLLGGEIKKLIPAFLRKVSTSSKA